MSAVFEKAFVGAAARGAILALLSRVNPSVAATGFQQRVRIDELVSTTDVEALVKLRRESVFPVRQ